MHWFQWWSVVSTVDCPCGCVDLSACNITKMIWAKKPLSGGFCLPPKKTQNMTIYFHFCIGRKTKPQAFYEKLFVGWNICFRLTCQGLIWISRIIFDKADRLSLSPSFSYTHIHLQSVSALDFRNFHVKTFILNLKKFYEKCFGPLKKLAFKLTSEELKEHWVFD